MSTKKQGGLSTADRLRLHQRAVAVLTEIARIEDVLRVTPPEWFEQTDDDARMVSLNELSRVDNLGFEFEMKLALAPIKKGTR